MQCINKHVLFAVSRIRSRKGGQTDRWKPLAQCVEAEQKQCKKYKCLGPGVFREFSNNLTFMLFAGV